MSIRKDKKAEESYKGVRKSWNNRKRAKSWTLFYNIYIRQIWGNQYISIRDIKWEDLWSTIIPSNRKTPDSEGIYRVVPKC